MSTHPVLTPYDSEYLHDLKSRIVMSAMTRGFADSDHRCTPEIAAYYERRAQSGTALILTEGIIVHPSGDGYNNVPHLHTQAQMLSWKQATEAVHRHGTKIYAQLWHCGRISHSDYTGGFDVVSSTDQPAAGVNRQNNKPYGTPRALEAGEMQAIYAMFADAAELALQAGFDGVQLHVGHGYLADQFLDARINQRTDAYGGSIENRCRFAVELVQAVISRVGAERVMARISPSRAMGGLYEWPDMDAMLAYLLPAFADAGLRQLDISCANANYFETSGKVIRQVRSQWPYFLIGGASLSVADADKEIEQGLVDAVTWGRTLLANPDLGTRIAQDQPLEPFTDAMRSTLV